ncbi:MAG TPA: acyl-ACP--UDP-N-acetylglucosamine O-acyltransferase [Candidatus Kapabacteria bacterium]|nr:acyl-ACP--UDP-N-acetylglucosamine O-acyltransferase [Candidatus Kapabacteria bacterium]
MSIHSTAIVSPKAELGANVEIGPYAIVEDDVTIGEGSRISHNAFIANGARIGKHCTVHHSAVVSNVPQDLKFSGAEKTFVEIADHTTIREFATIHRATEHSYKGNAGTHDGITRIGSHCLVMAYAHVAHDCSIGDYVVLSNGVQVAGHCTVESFVTVGGLTGIHQFSMIGAYSMVGAVLLVSKDIPPYSLIGSEPPRFIGINRIGLERRGFSVELIRKIRDVYKMLYFSGHNFSDALQRIERDTTLNAPETKRIVEFIRRSDRGIIGS